MPSKIDPLPPTLDSAVIEALDEKKDDSSLGSPFHLFAPNRPRLKGMAKRVTAELIKELSKPSPANGGGRSTQ